MLKVKCLALGVLTAALSVATVARANAPTSEVAPAPAAASLPQSIKVFDAGQEGINSYRIPSLIVTKNGVLLAIGEARRDSWRDKSPTKLVMRRSLDNGKTWEKTQVLHDAGDAAVMDPTPVIDEESGTIFLLHEVWPKGSTSKVPAGFGPDSTTCWIMSSTDDGATWTQARNITEQVKLPHWHGYAHGPGVGIQVKKGKARGRLIVPAHHIEEGTGWQNHLIVSDDRGKTWGVIDNLPDGLSDESQIVEQEDGGYLLNVRSGKGRRLVTVSKDEGKTWSEPRVESVMIEPKGCQASMIRYSWKDENGRSILLFSNPAHEDDRRNLTVRVSYDDGATWPLEKVIYPGATSYSCMAKLPDGSIGILYERGEGQSLTTMKGTRPAGWMSLSFVKFDLAWLEGK